MLCSRKIKLYLSISILLRFVLKTDENFIFDALLLILIDPLIEGIVEILEALLWFFLDIFSSYYLIDSQSLIPQGPNKLLTPPHSHPRPSDDVSFFLGGLVFSFFFNITVLRAFLRFKEWSMFLDFLTAGSLFPKLLEPLLWSLIFLVFGINKAEDEVLWWEWGSETISTLGSSSKISPS